MKSVFSIFLTSVIVLAFSFACFLNNSDDTSNTDQTDYFVEITVDGQTYRLTNGSTVESVPYVRVENTNYLLYASAETSVAENDVGETSRGIQAEFPTGQSTITEGDINYMYFSKTNNMSEHFNVLTMNISITNDSGSVFQGNFTGTMDKDGAGSYPVSGSFKVKRLGTSDSIKSTLYLGLLAEPESFLITQSVTYSFGVTNAKPDTFVKILDCTVNKGTWIWDSVNSVYRVNEGADASGELIPQGAITSEVELWVDGIKVKTFKEF